MILCYTGKEWKWYYVNKIREAYVKIVSHINKTGYTNKLLKPRHLIIIVYIVILCNTGKEWKWYYVNKIGEAYIKLVSNINKIGYTDKLPNARTKAALRQKQDILSSVLQKKKHLKNIGQLQGQ